jgi:NAD(P)H dehydrogenase (quinone)
MLSLTAGGPAAAYEKAGFNGDINAILRPVHRGILQFTGFEVLAPQIVYGPVRLEQSERTALLVDYAARLKTISSEPPLEVGLY